MRSRARETRKQSSLRSVEPNTGSVLGARPLQETDQ